MRWAGLILWFLWSTSWSLDVHLLNEAPCADDLLTWEIIGGEPAWLNEDVAVTPVLELRDGSGNTWRRSVYLHRRTDVGGSLRVHHTARVAGVLNWKLLSPSGAALSSGSVTVAAPRGPVGPIRISPTNHRLLSFADGTPFIPIGPNIAWAVGSDQRDQFNTWFSALSAAGGTHVRLWLSSWCGQFIGDKPTEWRLDQAQLVDDILAMARAKGLRVTVVIDNHHDFTTGKGAPYGPDRASRAMAFADGRFPQLYDQRLRYLFARWGADDTILAWEAFNELDLAANDDRFAAFWADALCRHLKELDPDGRIHTVSWSGTAWASAMEKPAVELAQIHLYVQPALKRDNVGAKPWRDFLGSMDEAASVACGLNKPFLFAELGYQGENFDNPGNERDPEGFLFFQQAWAGLMLGGCGSGMAWWWDVYVHPNRLWRHYAGLSRIVRVMDWRDGGLEPISVTGDIMRLVGWRSRRQALLWPVQANDTWYRVVVQQRPRPVLVQDMVIEARGFAPGRQWLIHYLDMRSGEERGQRSTVSNGEGVIRLSIPARTRDQVLWVEANTK